VANSLRVVQKYDDFRVDRNDDNYTKTSEAPSKATTMRIDPSRVA